MRLLSASGCVLVMNPDLLGGVDAGGLQVLSAVTYKLGAVIFVEMFLTGG